MKTKKIRRQSRRLMTTLAVAMAAMCGSQFALASTLNAITDVRVQSTATASQSFVPVTFGQVFAAGDIPKGAHLTAYLNGANILPLQVDAKATHPDGSLRHAIISTYMPSIAAGQTQTISFVRDNNSTQPGISHGPSELLNAGFTASVNVTLNGQVYSASADSLLRSGRFKTWLAGPLANEWIVSAPLQTSAGVAHPHLSARFAIRSYTDGRIAQVDVTVENDWAYQAAPQNYTYDVQVLVGGKTVYSKNNLDHYTQARWRKTFWWGNAPQTHIMHNTKYLIASKAVPNYDQSFSIASSTLDGLQQRFNGANSEPMATGLAAPYMPMTGGRPDIGLLPAWEVMYLLSMDKRAKDVSLGTANLAGSWSAHYRDKNTDQPVSPVDYPYISSGDPNVGDSYNPVTKKNEHVPACGGVCKNPNVADPAHQPSFAYLPYMVTGDYYYLEELQFYAMWNLVVQNPYYRGYAKGMVHSNQVRGQAWDLRTLADAAYITPDDDNLKQQFINFLSNNLDYYNQTYVNNTNPDNTLGVITEAAIEYSNNTGMAPWQDDFFTSAVGHVVDLGFTKALPLLTWKSKFPISRMANPKFCWILGAEYSLVVRNAAKSPLFTDIGQVYQASNPAALTSLSCAGQPMATKLGLHVGEMTGYSDSPTGFPSNMQPALAYSADIGGAQGATAWKVFSGRSVKPDYATGPQFAIIPRTSAATNGGGSPGK